MYSAVLLILKVASDVLAAMFGMLGLLFDFKDERQKITKMGKVALIGILASFSVSCVTTLLEAKKSNDEKKAEAVKAAEYERNIARLSHPFGEFELSTHFRIHDQPSPALEAFLNSRPAGFAKEKDIPENIRPSICCGYQMVGAELIFYHKGVSCSNDIQSKPDLILFLKTKGFGASMVADQENAEWSYHDNQLELSRSSKLEVIYDSGAIIGAEDLLGAMFLVVSGRGTDRFDPVRTHVPERQYDMLYFYLSFARGKSIYLSRFQPLPNEIYILDADGDRLPITADYCYTFSSDQLP